MPRNGGAIFTEMCIMAPSPGNELNFLGVDFDGLNIRPDKSCFSGLLGGIKAVIRSCDNHELAKKEICSLLNRWISFFSYSDIETYFDQIDTFISKYFLKKFQQNFPRRFQCKRLAFIVRNRQRAKSKSSFWHNIELKFVLPVVRWVKNWKQHKAA